MAVRGKSYMYLGPGRELLPLGPPGFAYVGKRYTIRQQYWPDCTTTGPFSMEGVRDSIPRFEGKFIHFADWSLDNPAEHYIVASRVLNIGRIENNDTTCQWAYTEVGGLLIEADPLPPILLPYLWDAEGTVAPADLYNFNICAELNWHFLVPPPAGKTHVAFHLRAHTPLD